MQLIVWQCYLRYKIIMNYKQIHFSSSVFRQHTWQCFEAVRVQNGGNRGIQIQMSGMFVSSRSTEAVFVVGFTWGVSFVLYFTQDAMRSVTKQAVKEARLKEIKQELLNSEKLKVCHRFVLSSSSLMSNDWLSLVWCVTDVLWRQSQRPAATATRQRPSSRRHQTSPEKRARLPG